MSTNLNLLSTGLIRLGVLIMLFIASPIVITMGFKAMDKFTEAPKSYIGYAVVAIGVILIIYSIYFAFKTFGVLSKAIFNSK